MTRLHRIATRLCTLLALSFGLVCSPASAQDSRVAAPAASANAIAPASDAWRAALPRDPEAATKAYLDRLTPAARARSDAYFEGGYWLQAGNLLLGLLVAWVLLQSRPAQAARRWCAGLSRRRFGASAGYGAFYLLTTSVLTLPLSIYQDFVREHQYGMATQSFAAWFGEQLTGLGVVLLIGPLFVLALYAVIRRAPRLWWLGGTAVDTGVPGRHRGGGASAHRADVQHLPSAGRYAGQAQHSLDGAGQRGARDQRL